MPFSGLQRSKDQKYYKNGTKETVFVYNLSFISDDVSRAETDLQNKYMTLYDLANFLNNIIY